MSIFITSYLFFTCFSTIGLHGVQDIPTTLNKAFSVFTASFNDSSFFTNRFISSLTKKGHHCYSNTSICHAGCISFHPG